MSRSKQKTIFFLGAGFSFPAGAPTQSKLTEEIDNFIPIHFIRQNGHLYSNTEKIKKLANLKKFIKDNFLLNLDNADLEDIYTPIDRCILDGISFKGNNPEKLANFRNKLNTVITLIMDSKLRYPVNDDYVRKMAESIVNSNQSGDKAVVFSTNWDILIDNRIFYLINGTGDVVDYCCHFTHRDGGERFPPPLVAKANRKHNHKILKLHGSFNWLWCSNCGRVQVKFGEKIALQSFFNDPACRFCNTNTLMPQIIMPTFLKDTSNTQLKNVWDQAGIELSEAKKIIFMGYSFPLADFEIRQLLARFVKPDTEIEVVLTTDSNPDKYSSLNDDIKNKIIWNLPSKRYDRFFAKNQPVFYYAGVENYINDKLVNTS